MNPLRLVIVSDLEHVVIVRSRLEGVILEIERLFRPVGHDLKEAEAEKMLRCSCGDLPSRPCFHYRTNCTRDKTEEKRCRSRIVGQVELTELVELVEFGFDNAPTEVPAVHVHDG